MPGQWVVVYICGGGEYEVITWQGLCMNIVVECLRVLAVGGGSC